MLIELKTKQLESLLKPLNENQLKNMMEEVNSLKYNRRYLRSSAKPLNKVIYGK